ncbi:hypothetical protein HPB51_000116 [Rhipicephalus microplus]|uniref:Tick transposon n=1 Tax=Rhipicephalus microplus TaxID=6941 RepID=A0A9J6DQW4_RHIMP|nr:hypothetical protein HPB51_000116 [Rhipicephalus microplus]
MNHRDSEVRDHFEGIQKTFFCAREERQSLVLTSTAASAGEAGGLAQASAKTLLKIGSTENWLKTCDGLQGKLSAWNTWRLLRDLIDPLNSKVSTNRNLANVLNMNKGDGRRLLEHLKYQDVMIQLHELVVKQATKHALRGILALDQKGPSDNESHASVLQNLNKTRYGRKEFGYISDFLSKLMATFRIVEEKLHPVELGDQGTPHLLVLSPLLFNLALLPLPSLLKQVEGVDHALHADDIMLWTARVGFDAWAEEALQRAATSMYEYDKLCVD